ncbi:MAG: hypothetical protein P8Z68_10070, partial [Kineosporiaceae bacterium]
MNTRERTIVRLVALAGIAVAATVVLAPKLADGVTCMVPRGTADSPQVHDGDLVLLRSRTEYRVGEIVGYPAPDRAGLTLREIRDSNPLGYAVTTADGTDVDPAPLAGDDILGRMWLRIPTVGWLLDGMRGRMALAALSALGFALIMRTGDGRSRAGGPR